MKILKNKTKGKKQALPFLINKFSVNPPTEKEKKNKNKNTFRKCLKCASFIHLFFGPIFLYYDEVYNATVLYHYQQQAMKI